MTPEPDATSPASQVGDDHGSFSQAKIPTERTEAAVQLLRKWCLDYDADVLEEDQILVDDGLREFPLAAVKALAFSEPARQHAENRINQLYAEKRVFVPDLLVALKDMKRAFGDPMTRRALGGHNEAQQAAILSASTAIAKATGGAGQ